MNRKPRILIVDDNPTNVELLRTQLKPYPYDLDTALDGEEALEKIPIVARITAVADAFDAMTTDRPYRKGMGTKAAIAIFEDEIKSGQWDPNCVRTLVEVVQRKL